MTPDRRMPEEILNSTEAKLLGVVLNAVQADMSEVKAELRLITEALAQLTKLETEHMETRSAMKRAFDEINRTNQRITDNREKIDVRITDIDKRLQMHERVMPGLIEARKWVVGMGVAAVAMLLVALASLVLSTDARTKVNKSVSMESDSAYANRV